MTVDPSDVVAIVRDDRQTGKIIIGQRLSDQWEAVAWMDAEDYVRVVIRLGTCPWTMGTFSGAPGAHVIGHSARPGHIARRFMLASLVLPEEPHASLRYRDGNPRNLRRVNLASA